MTIGKPTGAPTAALADFVAGLRYEDLPAPVVAQACRLVLDAVGCALAGWTEDPGKARVARDIAALYPASPGASVIGVAGLAAQPAFAALANGILVNAADNDDTHKRALLHAGSVVVPAALALAQTERLNGRETIVALVAGYEVAVRIGMAVMPTHYRFWHSTATNGTFGGAATAARALGLDAAGVLRTLGLAGTQAAGLNTFFESGDMTKSLHPGKAALNGVLSAQLARLGMTSPPGILASHSPIQATLAIVQRHAVDPRRIARITNETYRTVTTHFSAKEVGSAMAARVSVPYCIAVAAVDRALGQAQFAPARIADPLVRQVLARTEILADAALDRLYPANFPARVTVTLDSGESFAETVLLPKGDPGAPLTEAELDEKFRGNCAGMLPEAQAARLREAILGLPGAPTTEALAGLLVPGGS